MYDAERLPLVERTLVALFDDDERDVVYAEFLLVVDVRDCVAVVVAALRVCWLELDVLLLPEFTVLLLLVPTLWLRLVVALLLLV